MKGNACQFFKLVIKLPLISVIDEEAGFVYRAALIMILVYGRTSFRF